MKSNEKIATNILADKLAFLESAGILMKQIHPESKAKFLYGLTPKGWGLLLVLHEILVWNDKYFDIAETGKAFAARIRLDREETISDILLKCQKTL